MTERECPTCRKTFRPHSNRQKYCDYYCRERRPGRREYNAEYHRGKARANRGLCKLCGGPISPERQRCGAVYCGDMCSGNARRARNGYTAAYLVETRQEPLCVRWPLPPPDPAIVILPPRPAPTKVYRVRTEWPLGRFDWIKLAPIVLEVGAPALFQDDLAAIADHGSPWLPAPPRSFYAPVSVLAS